MCILIQIIFFLLNCKSSLLLFGGFSGYFVCMRAFDQESLFKMAKKKNANETNKQNKTKRMNKR